MVARATGSGQEPAPAATARRCPDARAAAAHGIGDARDGHRADAPRRRALDAQEGGAAGAGTRGPGAALPRRGSTRRHGMHVVSAFVLLLSYAATRVQAAGGSGLFRFGHISWHAQGNTVSFTLETAFRKSVSDPKFRDAKVGDRLLLFGKEPPQFLYGDSQFASTLVMEVTAVSETEDWVMGVTELKHTYATPNNKQRPWRAQLVGCCRLSEMKNNADLGFELTAEVDLTVAKRSPRAATLPMVTVPLAGKPDGNAHAAAVPPSAYIPSRSGNNVAWNVGTPIDVGSAAALKSASHSYLELPLSGLQQTGHTCDQNSVGAGCFVQMLSGDPTVGGGAAALTVEGWVKLASPEGGYILSTNHLSVSGKRISTLSVVANETHIVVGHERESGENASVASFHMAFATGANLTDRWSHVALVRTLEATDSSKTQCSTQDSVAAHHAVCSRTDDGCHCPLCGATPGLETVAYRVYLDGHELFQEGVDPADIEVVCGPQCNGTACVSATEGSLVFGAYGGPRGGAGMYLDGWLDEWRFWNGVRTQGKIQEFYKDLMKPSREAFDGDPTANTITNDNYKTLASVLAVYSMDYMCPIGVARPCAITNMLPVYPKDASAGSPYTLVARGHVTTAPPDSQGVMMWQTAVDERVGVDSAGRVTFDPSKGPGDYQVTVMLANVDGSAQVPLDLIVRVLATTSYDDAQHTFALNADSPYAGNAYVPRLQLLGSVVPNGFCSGNVTPTTTVSPVSDLTFLAFPCSLNTWAGFEMRLEARGHDISEGHVSQVGFVVGPKPAGMKIELLRADEYGRMSVAWTPCHGDVGSHVVCLSAEDAQPGVKSAASEQMCVMMQVLADPAPYFDVGPGKTTTGSVHAVIGRESVVSLYAVDDNCLDEIEISIEELPPGGVLESQPPPSQQCTSAHSIMRFTPPFNLGGWDVDLCFNVSDSPGACGEPAHKTQHCVRVFVERCVYAMQPDQQLQEVANFYEASWMQLWSLNQHLRHPDIIMYEKQVINVGHKYRAGPKETVQRVARRMGMSLKQLMLLNYDLKAQLEGNDEVPLALHQQLCLIPNSCTGLASTTFSQIKLEDEDTLAKYAADALSVPAA